MKEPAEGLMTVEELNEHYLSLTSEEKKLFKEKLAELYDFFGIEDDVKIEGLVF